MTAPSREPTEAMRREGERIAFLSNCNGEKIADEIARALAEQDTAARLAALELAAKAVCPFCKAGDPIVPGGDHSSFLQGHTYFFPCRATAIRALSVTPPEAASEKPSARVIYLHPDDCASRLSPDGTVFDESRCDCGARELNAASEKENERG